MKRITPDHARKMREGAARARAARSPSLEARLRAAHSSAQRKIAEEWVHEAMREGLEWAVKNPDTFIKNGGQTIGRILTEGERRHVEVVLTSLLERLVGNKLRLWKWHQGRNFGSRNRKTIERELAEHGARRGW